MTETPNQPDLAEHNPAHRDEHAEPDTPAQVEGAELAGELVPVEAAPLAVLPRKGLRYTEVPAEDVTREEAERWLAATTRKGWLGGSIVGSLLGMPSGDATLGKDAGHDLMRALFDDVKPRSQVERLLVEQLGLLHGQILRSHTASLAKYADNREKALQAVSRLSGDFRKTLGALQTLRAPMPSTVFANQANFAGQQVVINGDVQPNEVGAHDAP